MKALISPTEIIEVRWVSSWIKEEDTWKPVVSVITECQRVADVSETGFEVAHPLFWLDCPNDCLADYWYFKDGQVQPKPQDEPMPE